jgi:hypothetical protein
MHLFLCRDFILVKKVIIVVQIIFIHYLNPLDCRSTYFIEHDCKNEKFYGTYQQLQIP